MRRGLVAVAVAAVVALAASGCDDEKSASGSQPDDPLPGAPIVAEHSSHGAVMKAYQAGKGIEPGVYIARAGCTGIAASSASYDLFDNKSADDDYLRGSMQVGDRSRVAVRRGEFLHLDECTWQREDPAGPRTPDPATRAGACTILLGPDAVAETAVNVLKAAAAGDDERVGEIQEKLMAVVFSRTKGLWNQAGELVDFLDAPDAFVDAGTVDQRVTRAIVKIRQVCGNT